MLPQTVLMEKVTDLNANLSIFIRIEGSDPAFGRTKGMASQPFLFIGILQDMVGHQQLGPF